MKTLQEIQEFNRIIGKPITLSRVLLAIRERGYFDDIYFGDETATLEFDIEYLSWDLTKETLEEQSEHTQMAIFKLLGGKDDDENQVGCLTAD